MKLMLLPLAGAVAATAVTGAAASGASSQPVTSAPATVKLTIQHVVRGCHVWSDGSHRSASMSLTLKRGQAIRITDMDVDPHRLVQVAGPSLRLHGHMMMGGIQSVVFKQRGVYRLTTKTVEMGRMMDVKTVGPDNTLRLRIRVL